MENDFGRTKLLIREGEGGMNPLCSPACNNILGILYGTFNGIWKNIEKRVPSNPKAQAQPSPAQPKPSCIFYFLLLPLCTYHSPSLDSAARNRILPSQFPLWRPSPPFRRRPSPLPLPVSVLAHSTADFNLQLPDDNPRPAEKRREEAIPNDHPRPS